MIEIGSQIPPFFAKATTGDFSLRNHLTRRLVLFFYPRDNTSGCTMENEEFRDLHPKFVAAEAQVVGVSRDTLQSHARFAAKLKLPFPLIADPKEELCNLFDVMRTKNMYGKQVRGIERSTFVLSRDGILEQQWRKVKAPGHAAEVLGHIQGT